MPTGTTPSPSSAIGRGHRFGRPARTPPTWRRWTTRIALALLALALLIALDRVAPMVAARNLADRVQSTEHLTARPDVVIAGFPFLLQVVKGHYDDVAITANVPIQVNGVRIVDVVAQLHGVKVGIGDAIHGTISDLPVQSGTGTALITYPQLDTIVHRYGGTVGQQITIRYASPGRARLLGPLGLSSTVTAAVTGGNLVITPDPAELNALPALVKPLINAVLATPIPLPAFPFNVQLNSVQFEATGVQLIAQSTNSAFPSGKPHPGTAAEPPRRVAADEQFCGPQPQPRQVGRWAGGSQYSWENAPDSALCNHSVVAAALVAGARLSIAAADEPGDHRSGQRDPQRCVGAHQISAGDLRRKAATTDLRRASRRNDVVVARCYR